MSRFYWPLTPERDRVVRERVAKRLKERHDRNWDARMDEIPILEFPSGREELAWYRSREMGWWTQLAETYPERARWRLMRYAKLVRQYGPVVPV